MQGRATTSPAGAGLPGRRPWSGAAGEGLGVGTSPFRASLGLAVLTAAAAPAYVVRWHVGPLPTTLLEALIGLTVLAFAVESARAGVRLAWRTPYTYAAALFLLAGLVAVVVAPDRRAAVGLYRAYLLEPVAFFFVLGEVVRTSRAAYVTLAGLALGGLVAGLANSAV